MGDILSTINSSDPMLVIIGGAIIGGMIVAIKNSIQDFLKSRKEKIYWEKMRKKRGWIDSNKRCSVCGHSKMWYDAIRNMFVCDCCYQSTSYEYMECIYSKLENGVNS